MVKILTQDNCKNCELLKMFLKNGLGGSLDHKVEFIHKAEKPEEYAELVEKHSVMSTPFLVSDSGETLPLAVFDPMKAEKFISNN